MSALSSPSTWRTHPHTVTGHLYAYVPEVVFACTINQATFNYPVAIIPYDGVSVGSYSDVVVGMTVRFRSSAGAILGYGRIRSAATANNIFVGAIPRGDIEFADDDIIEVLDDYRIWSKIPAITVTNALTATFLKDYAATYTDQGTSPPPVANVGPHVAGFVGDDGYLYVSFRGESNSYAIDEGESISLYLNDIGDGEYVTGDASAGDFDARFPAGARWVSLRVTDTNGKTHTARRHIAALERTGTNAPIRCRLNNLSLELSGATAEFAILENDASIDVIPEGALVIYFEEETYGGVSGSINAYDYDNVTYKTYAGVKFVGWTIGNDSAIQPETNDITVRALGPAGILGQLDMFSQSVINAATSMTWYKLADLTLWKFIWYLFQWHTTALDVCDLIRPAWYDVYPYHRFDITAGSPYDVIDQVAQYVNANLTCDRLGNLFVPRNPQMMTDEDRDLVVTTVTLADSDWTNIQAQQSDRDVDHWVRGSGLLASNSVTRPFLSIAPGKSPGQGAIEEQLDKQLVVGQDDLNVRTGRYYGLKNTRWPAFSTTILNAGLIAEPALREWIYFDLADVSSKRNITPPVRNVLRGVRYTYDPAAGASIEEWTFEPETFGPPGETIRIPGMVDNSEVVGLPRHREVRYTQYDPRKRASVPRYAYMVLRTSMYYTSTLDELIPSWSECAINIIQEIGGLTPQFYHVIIDPHSPSHIYILVQDSDAGTGYVLYADASNSLVWDYEIIYQGSFGSDGYPLDIAVSPRVDGAVWIVTQLTADNELGAWYRPDYSSSFTYTELGDNLFYARVATGHSRSSFVTAAVNVLAYDSIAGEIVWLRSTDGGISYAEYHRTVGDGIPCGITVSFQNTALEQRMYAITELPDEAVLYSNDAGVVADVPPGVAAAFSQYPLRPGLLVSTKDSDFVAVLMYAAGSYGVLYTEDAGSTWDAVVLPYDGSGTADELLSIYGTPWDDNYLLLVGTTGSHQGIWRTKTMKDAEDTWRGVLGNLDTSIMTNFVGLVIKYT